MKWFFSIFSSLSIQNKNFQNKHQTKNIDNLFNESLNEKKNHLFLYEILRFLKKVFFFEFKSKFSVNENHLNKIRKFSRLGEEGLKNSLKKDLILHEDRNWRREFENTNTINANEKFRSSFHLNDLEQLDIYKHRLLKDQSLINQETLYFPLNQTKEIDEFSYLILALYSVLEILLVFYLSCQVFGSLSDLIAFLSRNFVILSPYFYMSECSNKLYVLSLFYFITWFVVEALALWSTEEEDIDDYSSEMLEEEDEDLGVPHTPELSLIYNTLIALYLIPVSFFWALQFYSILSYIVVFFKVFLWPTFLFPTYFFIQFFRLISYAAYNFLNKLDLQARRPIKIFKNKLLKKKIIKKFYHKKRSGFNKTRTRYRRRHGVVRSSKSLKWKLNRLNPATSLIDIYKKQREKIYFPEEQIFKIKNPLIKLRRKYRYFQRVLKKKRRSRAKLEENYYSPLYENTISKVFIESYLDNILYYRLFPKVIGFTKLNDYPPFKGDHSLFLVQPEAEWLYGFPLWRQTPSNGHKILMTGAWAGLQPFQSIDKRLFKGYRKKIDSLYVQYHQPESFDEKIYGDDDLVEDYLLDKFYFWKNRIKKGGQKKSEFATKLRRDFFFNHFSRRLRSLETDINFGINKLDVQQLMLWWIDPHYVNREERKNVLKIARNIARDFTILTQRRNLKKHFFNIGGGKNFLAKYFLRNKLRVQPLFLSNEEYIKKNSPRSFWTKLRFLIYREKFFFDYLQKFRYKKMMKNHKNIYNSRSFFVRKKNLLKPSFFDVKELLVLRNLGKISKRYLHARRKRFKKKKNYHKYHKESYHRYSHGRFKRRRSRKKFVILKRKMRNKPIFRKMIKNVLQNKLLQRLSFLRTLFLDYRNNNIEVPSNVKDKIRKIWILMRLFELYHKRIRLLQFPDSSKNFLKFRKYKTKNLSSIIFKPRRAFIRFKNRLKIFPNRTNYGNLTFHFRRKKKNLKFLKLKHILWRKWKNFKYGRVKKFYNNVENINRKEDKWISYPVEEEGFLGAVQSSMGIHDMVLPDEVERSINLRYASPLSLYLEEPELDYPNFIASSRISDHYEPSAKREGFSYSLLEDIYRYKKLNNLSKLNYFYNFLKKRGQSSRKFKKYHYESPPKWLIDTLLKNKVLANDAPYVKENGSFFKDYLAYLMRKPEFVDVHPINIMFRNNQRLELKFKDVQKNFLNYNLGGKKSVELLQNRSKFLLETLSSLVIPDEEEVLDDYRETFNFRIPYLYKSSRFNYNRYLKSLSDDYYKSSELLDDEGIYNLRFSDINCMLQSLKRNYVAPFNRSQNNLSFFLPYLERPAMGIYQTHKIKNYYQSKNVPNLKIIKRNKPKRKEEESEDEEIERKLRERADFYLQERVPFYLMNFSKNFSRVALNKGINESVIFHNTSRVLKNHRWLKLSKNLFTSFGFQYKLSNKPNLVLDTKLKFFSKLSKYVQDAIYLYVLGEKLNFSPDYMFGKFNFQKDEDETQVFLFNLLLRKYIQKLLISKNDSSEMKVSQNRKLKDLLLFLKLRKVHRKFNRVGTINDVNFRYKNLHRIRLHFSRFLFWLIREEKYRIFLVRMLKKQRQIRWGKEGYFLTYPNILLATLQKRKRKLFYKKFFNVPGIISDTNNLFFSHLYNHDMYTLPFLLKSKLYKKQSFILNTLKADYFNYRANNSSDYKFHYGWGTDKDTIGKTYYGMQILNFMKKLKYRSYLDQLGLDFLDADGFRKVVLGSKNLKEYETGGLYSNFLKRKRKWRYINQFFMKKLSSNYNITSRDKILLKRKHSRLLKYNKYNYIFNNITENQPLVFRVKEKNSCFFFDWDYSYNSLGKTFHTRQKNFVKNFFPLYSLNFKNTFFDLSLHDKSLENVENIFLNSSRNQRNIEMWPRFVSKTLREKSVSNFQKNYVNFFVTSSKVKMLLPYLYSRINSFHSQGKFFGRSRVESERPERLGLLKFLRHVWLERLLREDVSLYNISLNEPYLYLKNNYAERKHIGMPVGSKFVSARPYIFFYKFLNKKYIEHFIKTQQTKKINLNHYSDLKDYQSKIKYWKSIKSIFKFKSERSFLLWIKRRYINSFRKKMSENNFLWKKSSFNSLPTLTKFTHSYKTREFLRIRKQAMYAKGKIKFPAYRIRDNFFLKRHQILKKLKNVIFASKATGGFLFYYYKIRDWNDRLISHVDSVNERSLDFELESVLIERSQDLLVPSYWAYKLPDFQFLENILSILPETKYFSYINDHVALVIKMYPLIIRENFLKNSEYNSSFLETYVSQESSNFLFFSGLSHNFDELLLAEQLNFISDYKILKYIRQYEGLIQGRKREKFFNLSHIHENYLKIKEQGLFDLFGEYEKLEKIKPFFMKTNETLYLSHNFLQNIQHQVTMTRFYNLVNFRDSVNALTKMNFSDELTRLLFYNNFSALENLTSTSFFFRISVYFYQKHYYHNEMFFYYVSNFFRWLDEILSKVCDFFFLFPIDYLRSFITVDWWYSSEFFSYVLYSFLISLFLILYYIILIFYRLWYIYKLPLITRKFFEQGDFLSSILVEHKTTDRVLFSFYSLGHRKTKIWLYNQIIFKDERVHADIVYVSENKKDLNFSDKTILPDKEFKYNQDYYLNSLYNSSLDMLSSKVFSKNLQKRLEFKALNHKYQKYGSFGSLYYSLFFGHLKPIYFTFNGQEEERFRELYSYKDSVSGAMEDYGFKYDSNFYQVDHDLEGEEEFMILQDIHGASFDELFGLPVQDRSVLQEDSLTFLQGTFFFFKFLGIVFISFILFLIFLKYSHIFSFLEIVLRSLKV